MDRTMAAQALLLLSLSLVFHVSSQSTTAPMEKAEQDTLYLAIQDLVGKWWNGSWLYPDPCGWTPIQGVSCDIFDGLWYVTVLSIGPILDNSLECEPEAKFSPHLFELRHLRSLTFYSCFSSPGRIPSGDWEKLAGSLESLELRSNRGLTGEIPASFGLLLNLQSLVLVENALTGDVPHELGNLVQLKRLVLSGNRITGRIPASIGGSLAQLLILDLNRNSITGLLPSSLGGLASLLKLDLSNNMLDGSIPGELGNLKSLTLLDLKNNNLTGGLAQPLQGLVAIQDLLLANNPIGGHLTGFGWEKLQNLSTLHLSNMGLVGGIPESITGLKRLRFLGLDGNHLTGSVTPKLAALPCLRALYLNGNNLTGELVFPAEFYERMGGRFASWGNPDLCYNAAPSATGHDAPLGVGQCKIEKGDHSINSPDSKNKIGGDGSPDHNRSSSMASSGLSASGSWWVLLAIQELVVAASVIMAVL